VCGLDLLGGRCAGGFAANRPAFDPSPDQIPVAFAERLVEEGHSLLLVGVAQPGEDRAFGRISLDHNRATDHALRDRVERVERQPAREVGVIHLLGLVARHALSRQDRADVALVGRRSVDG